MPDSRVGGEGFGGWVYVFDGGDCGVIFVVIVIVGFGNGVGVGVSFRGNWVVGMMMFGRDIFSTTLASRIE